MKNRNTAWALLAVVLAVAVLACACGGMAAAAAAATLGYAVAQTSPSSPAFGDAVGVLYLEGTIASGGSYSSSVVTPERVDELLRQAAADPSIKSVVVTINSPGGSAVASDRIYRALLDFEKPVVIWMSEMAASGGYYIACAGDVVIAHPDSLTGSIGVITQFLTAEELMNKIGVEVVIITSGPRKDIGSPYRDMTEEERALWETIITEVYEDFVQVVAEARGMSLDEVRELADGRVYTGRQALEAGLVDEVGTLENAIAKAARMGGIEGEPRVVELRAAPSLADLLYGLRGPSALPTLEEILMWTGVPSLQMRAVSP